MTQPQQRDELEEHLLAMSFTVPDRTGVVRYKTQFSTYEVDWTNLRVRRMEGQLNPTPRQGPVGEWQNALRIGVGWGNCLVFVWRIEDGVAKSTITSQIVSEEAA
jgi:hypothetical protein